MAKTEKGTQPDLLDAQAQPKPHAVAHGKPPAMRERRKTNKKPGTAVAVTNGPTPQSMMAMLATAAADPAVDTAKMRAIYELNAQIVFAEQFVAMKYELPEIDQRGRIVIREKEKSTGERTGRIQQSSGYSKLIDIQDAVEPILKHYGFAISSAIQPSTTGERIVVCTVLLHQMGHMKASEFPLPAETSGSKNNVQGWGSAASYGRRYNVMALLDIKSRAPIDDAADDDGQGAVNNMFVSDEQAKQIRDALDAGGPRIDRFCEAMGVDGVAKIPVKQFRAALDRIAQFKREKARRLKAGGESR